MSPSNTDPGWCSVDSSLSVMLYFPLPMFGCSCSFSVYTCVSVTPCLFKSVFFPHSLLVCFVPVSAVFLGSVFLLHLPSFAVSSCHSGVYFAFCLYLVCFFAHGLLLFCRLTFCPPVIWIIRILDLDLLFGFAFDSSPFSDRDSHWVMWRNGICALELQAAAGLQLDSELTFLHVDAS